MIREGKRKGRARGAAVLELALVLPLFVVLLLFGMYLTELARAKLRLLEAARFLAWEMTSYPLGGFGQGSPAAAFETARKDVLAETGARYRDLDSAADVPPRAFGVEYEGLQARVFNEAAPLSELRLGPEVEGDGGPWAARAIGLARRGLRASLRDWGFNLRGQVRAEVSLTLRSTLLPVHFLDGEGGFFREPLRDERLGGVMLRSKLTLLADGWHLPDGADATIAGGRAGSHAGGRSQSGLLLQVRRMRFWGDEGFVESGLPFLGGIRSVLPLPLPEPSGAFVVSHNYGPEPQRGCKGIPGYPSDARGGLSSLKGLIDHDRPVCFDTAPFRDTQEYRSSLYLRMFEARGPHFMGCQRAQAEDPSSPRDRDRGDRHLRKVDCEVER